MNSNWELFGDLPKNDSLISRTAQLSASSSSEISDSESSSISPTPIPGPMFEDDLRGKMGYPISIYPFQPYPLIPLVPQFLY